MCSSPNTRTNSGHHQQTHARAFAPRSLRGSVRLVHTIRWRLVDALDGRGGRVGLAVANVGLGHLATFPSGLPDVESQSAQLMYAIGASSIEVSRLSFIRSEREPTNPRTLVRTTEPRTDHQTVPTSKVLDLSGNALGDAACAALARGLRQRRGDAKKRPSRLDLRASSGGDAGGSGVQLSAESVRQLLDAGAELGAPNDEWLLYEAEVDAATAPPPPPPPPPSRDDAGGGGSNGNGRRRRQHASAARQARGTDLDSGSMVRAGRASRTGRRAIPPKDPPEQSAHREARTQAQAREALGEAGGGDAGVAAPPAPTTTFMPMQMPMWPSQAPAHTQPPLGHVAHIPAWGMPGVAPPVYLAAMNGDSARVSDSQAEHMGTAPHVLLSQPYHTQTPASAEAAYQLVQASQHQRAPIVMGGVAPGYASGLGGYFAPLPGPVAPTSPQWPPPPPSAASIVILRAQISHLTEELRAAEGTQGGHERGGAMREPIG